MFGRLPVFQRFPNPDPSDDGLEQSEPRLEVCLLCVRALGGPSRIRLRIFSGESRLVYRLSSHHVMPASMKGATFSLSLSRFVPVVHPMLTKSNFALVIFRFLR